jgi:putative ABC transport system permease protein
VAVAAVVTTAASLAGTWGTLFRVATMPPIVAMSAPAAAYRPTLLDRLRVLRVVGPPLRMIIRNVQRKPLRAALTVGGMSLAVAILVLGDSSADSLTRMIDVQFHAAQREDVSVVLAQRRSLDAWRDVFALPGVRVAEPYRAVPARIRAAGRAQDVTLLGLMQAGTLRRIVDSRFQTLAPPSDGILINQWLAQRLRIRRGDLVAVEVREDDRRTVAMRVVGLVDEPIGSFAYAELDNLGRALGQPHTFSGLHLLVDPQRQQDLYATLKRAPQALAVQTRRHTLSNFRSMVDTSLAFVRQIEIVFSVIIAFGVVYNAARIALAERGYELATLRVLGFTRREISAILLGEIGVLAVLAVPLGFATGYGLSAWVSAGMSNDRFRMPVVVDPGTYAFALAVFATATLGSALLVRRRLDRLDLVDVLKARE